MSDSNKLRAGKYCIDTPQNIFNNSNFEHILECCEYFCEEGYYTYYNNIFYVCYSDRNESDLLMVVPVEMADKCGSTYTFEEDIEIIKDKYNLFLNGVSFDLHDNSDSDDECYFDYSL